MALTEETTSARVVRALLADGSIVRMRRLDGADAPSVEQMYRALPAYDRYLRFFSAGVVPRAGGLASCTAPGYAAVGAFRGDRLIGVAEYVIVDGPTTAEVGLVVAHPDQARGVGTLLLEHLGSAARRCGVRRFVAEVLEDNTAMRRVFNDLGLPYRFRVLEGSVHVEVDLEPGKPYLAALAEREERADRASLATVLAPGSLAVVGAGRKPDSVGHAVLANIVAADYAGRLYAVNPHATQVCGIECVASVADLPEAVDLAVVCVPARAVPDVADACGRRGVRALLVISSGLSADPPSAVRLIEAVRRYDMRMVGPNCLGVSNTDPAVRLDAGFAPPSPPGDIGLVTQSGGVAIAVQAELRRLGLGTSTTVSTGDKYDVSGNDLLLWWNSDPNTRMAVLYLESFGNPRKFSRFSRGLAAQMPVLTVRSGSSEAGQRAAASHTASTATPRVTRDALFRQAGVLAVDRLDELTELIATLSWQPLPAGRRVAVISNAGGAGVLAADACAAAGLEVSALSGHTRRALSHRLGRPASLDNPVDTSAVVAPETFADAVAVLLAAPEVDAVIALTVPTAVADPFPGMTRAAARSPGTPLLAVRLGQAEHIVGVADEDGRCRLPCFADPAAAAAALARAADRSAWLARPGATSAVDEVDATAAAGIVAAFLAAHPAGGWLESGDVQDLLAAYGLPILRGELVDGPERAVAAFTRAGGPVALKAIAYGVVHKAAAGGVRLGADSPDAVARAARELAARFGGRLHGILVQPMAPPGPELLVGVVGDPEFGPLVTVGLGGTATDLAADRAHRLVPLAEADAEDMLRDFRAGEQLFGPQRRPRLDRAAVRDVIARVGVLAEQVPEVVELDLNPVIAGPGGCVAVDARIRVAPPPGGDPAVRALRL
ncbi:GNAT family N-acetyltransferase [Pseudonocardia zijingensis]|uniref:Bifunctional GNAT family N-acetyltransferase/acetate--CoA ligase family protein n=1 Tax=Pseudonocardia zijingensis TaxID=153376 RepID=A0ABN1PCE5_9PSEU